MRIDNLISKIKIRLNNYTIDDRIILSIVDDQRSLQIKNYVNKNAILNNSFQILKVPIIKYGPNMMISEREIPNTIRNNFNDGVLAVSFDDLELSEIQYLPEHSNLSNYGISQSTSSLTYAKSHNGKLIIKNTVNPTLLLCEYIYVKGYFSHPISVIKYNNPNMYNSELYLCDYPINDELYAYIEPEIIKALNESGFR